MRSVGNSNVSSPKLVHVNVPPDERVRFEHLASTLWQEKPQAGVISAGRGPCFNRRLRRHSRTSGSRSGPKIEVADSADVPRVAPAAGYPRPLVSKPDPAVHIAVPAYELKKRREIRRKQQNKPTETRACECSPRRAGSVSTLAACGRMRKPIRRPRPWQHRRTFAGQWRGSGNRAPALVSLSRVSCTFQTA